MFGFIFPKRLPCRLCRASRFGHDVPLPAIFAAMIIDNTSETLRKVTVPAVDVGEAAVPDRAIPDVSLEPARPRPRCGR